MNRTLFGDPLPARYGRSTGRQQQFGEGAEWIDAARDWCAANGLTLERFEAGGRFRAAGVWHTIGHNGEDWVVELEDDECST